MGDGSGVQSAADELLPEAVRGASQALAVGLRRRLARQGDVPRYMHCVLAGEVRLMRVGRRGESFILQRVRRGWVAEASLFARRYHCDLEAAAGTRLARVPVAVVRRALEDSPEFRRYWIAALSREIWRLRGVCERLGLRDAASRVLHAIASEGENGSLRVAGTLKDWAGELGLTHETLYRALARLERSGLLGRGDGLLKVMERPAGRPRGHT